MIPDWFNTEEAVLFAQEIVSEINWNILQRIKTRRKAY
jgi:hypothetical protein